MAAKDQAVRFIAATAAYMLAAWATLLVTRASGGIATIWIANVVILGYALHRPAAPLPMLLAAVLVGGTVVSTLVNGQFVAGILAALCNCVEITIVYAAAKRLGLRPGMPLRDRDVLLFLVLCVLLAPAVGAVFGAFVVGTYSSAPWVELWAAWWRADAFGMFVGMPLVWAFDRRAARMLIASRQALVFWSLVAVSLAVTCVALVRAPQPFVLITLPLLLVAMRSGVFGTAVCNALVIATILAVTHLQLSGALPGPARSPFTFDTVWVLACASAVGPIVVAIMSDRRERERLHALRTSERLRIITDALPAFIAELGPDLRYRFANAQYQKTFGLAPGQIIGRHVRDVLGRRTEMELRPRMHRALQGHAERFEFALPDGTVLDAAYQPLQHSRSFLVLSQDVTWRHEAERRVRNLLESAPDGMVVVDAAARRIVLVNQEVERMFGHSRDALVGQPIGRFIDNPHELVRAMARACPSERAETPGSDVLELQGRRRDGTRFPLEVVFRWLHGSEGTQVVAAVRDVTERRRTERALQEERERAQVTLDSIGDAVITYDTAQCITSMNPIAEDITGWSRADAVGRPLWAVVCLLEPDHDARLPFRTAVDGERDVVLAEATARLRRRDGPRLHVEVSDAPLRSERGYVIGGVLVVRDISEAHAMAQRMAHLARHDHLTGLPNRMALQDGLEAVLAGAANGGGALLFLDLDLFKRINDSLGHHAGDVVLQVIAQRLVSVVQPGDTVCRLGGDEFVVLLPRLSHPSEAAHVATALIDAIEAPVTLDERQLHVSASVGITLFPRNSRDSKTLIKQADTALYHAKQAGRGRHSFFTGAMSERADRRLQLENDLRAALDAGDLCLEYQPKVALPARRVCGMEALVRWRRPDGRTIAPGDFIPVAEETGLVTAIDEWVLREACRQCRAWIDAGLAPVPVAVNVSMARLDAERLLGSLRAALDESGLPPELLEVELTESQMLGQHAPARRLVDGIRALGIRLAVDDFGTGYSSLSYLTDYRFDTIKIDRSFVQGLPEERERRAVAQAILGIARSLECDVVAEGVETEAQAAALYELGCDQMQGFLFAHPASPDALEVHLRRPPAPLH